MINHARFEAGLFGIVPCVIRTESRSLFCFPVKMMCDGLLLVLLHESLSNWRGSTGNRTLLEQLLSLLFFCLVNIFFGVL